MKGNIELILKMKFTLSGEHKSSHKNGYVPVPTIYLFS